MSKKAKDAEIHELSDRMLLVLESQRQLGGDAYPPTLRRLGELSGAPSSEEHIRKAAGKKTFTARAVVTEKVDKKPSLDAPVYFKEDVPDPLEILAGRMLRVLESQRPLGGDAYPPTLRRLAELSGLKASDTRVPKAATLKAMSEKAVVAAKDGQKPSLDAPVLLNDDIEGEVLAILPAMLRFLQRGPVSSPKGKPKPTTHAFSLDELEKKLHPDLLRPFGPAVSRGIDQQTLPSDVAWVLLKDKPLLFLVENLRPEALRQPLPVGGHMPAPSPSSNGSLPVPAQPTRDFAEAFREAFERLDRRNGSTNFVKLSDLRDALSEFGRDAFDAGLRQLRLDGQFSLDSHEGLYGALTPEDREAGVREAGSLLIYASRR